MDTSWNDQVKIGNGKKVVSHSTRGREVLCEWKDGGTSLQKLSDLKECLHLPRALQMNQSLSGG